MSVTTIIKRLSIATAGAATIALTTASTASAASITFDFSGNGGQEESFTLNQDGLEVTATGSINDGANTARDVFQSSEGFGVTEGPGERNQIDGDTLSTKETLNLSFDNLVTLLSATFTDVDSGDDFQLFVDGNQLVSSTPIPANGVFDFTSNNANGTVLGFSLGDDTDNEYFLKNVTVQKAAVQEVPEPVTLLGSLLASGFGAIFYKKRKNQSDITA
ncbi:MAG: PEP-CTERM sorting domain-containing protein [Rivularia sp. ALOHA_DT_140]|nr:PEP-CTERM sorting domain-containing protein [Rivularia sp. ALOHA_DT_140]